MEYNISALFDLIKDIPPYTKNYHGRGVVISAGGLYLPSAYLAVRSLRASGCMLPIQIWYMGYEEFPDILHPLFIAEGVEPVNANEIRKIHPMRIWGGWQSKPYSILYSPFREVFSFDADNIALLNPELLFNTPEYQQYGSMFWPDFYSDKWEYWMIKPEAWSLLGLEPQKNVEIETGQVLIDKERNWEALCVAFHFNSNSDFYYEKCTYGDTDTYTLAWMMLNKQRYVVPHQPKLLEHMVRIHYTPTGENLFQHSRKWVLPTKDNAHLPTYLRENQCLEWLQVFEDTFLQAQRGG